jgi:hypothetical protein
MPHTVDFENGLARWLKVTCAGKLPALPDRLGTALHRGGFVFAEFQIVG